MLILDPNKYKASVPQIKRLWEMRRKDKDPSEVTTEISVALGIPIMAIAMWIQCLYGANEAISKQMKMLQEFYKYESILELEYENFTV